jgi:DNA-binding NarL/FixJ family response regulator/predicted regulator of Ras-like GTPase activity (Roadblock/LC7/MglB family)
MASLPRIITVDPTGAIPQQIRAALDLMDRLIIQIDVPGPHEALDELKRGGINAVIAAWTLGNGMQGWELAGKLKQIDSKVAIMVFGDYDDTELDEEMLEQSPFVYLKRPFDVPQLLNVLKAALEGGDIKAALKMPSAANSTTTTIGVDLGAVPTINADSADKVLQGVMSDFNPIAAMVTGRDGSVVVGRTTTKEIDPERMAQLISHTATVTIDMREVIGGSTRALQFFDGDDYDVFVVSVGLHHFLVIVFDGKEGQKQMGPVNRFGFKRAEELIAVIGPSAFLIIPSAPKEEGAEVRRKSEQAKKVATQEIAIPELVRADLGASAAGKEKEVVVDNDPTPAMQAVIPQLEAISDADFDINDLFGGDFDEAAAEDLFSLDAIEELAAEDNKKGTLDWDKANELGILGDI